MASTLLFPQSGGITLVSGSLFSGHVLQLHSVALKLAKAAPGLIYVSLPPFPFMSGLVSGIGATGTSGGSMTSGGLTDGIEMSPGDAYTVDASRMQSGIESIRLVVPAASSGGRLGWEVF